MSTSPSQEPAPSQQSGRALSASTLPRRDWLAIGALIFAGLPGVAALIALLFTYQQVHATNQQVHATNVQLQIAEQGQITDRYNAAITNLGSRSIEVRLGGIYALQRLMQDSPRDQSTIIAVLCAFVRDQAASDVIPPRPSASRLSTDVQAALTVVGTRNTAHDNPTTVIDFDHAQLANAQFGLPFNFLHPYSGPHFSYAGADFSYADLTKANLSYADLTGVDLTGANLTHATLVGTNLTSAVLSTTSLTGAYISGVNLTGAYLSGVNLTKADLASAILTRANLASADLSYVNLPRMNLGGADLTGANLTGAGLTGADLSGAKLSGAKLSYTDLTGASLTGADLVGANLSYASLAGADLARANLSGANLSSADLTGADLAGAEWSQNVPAPKGWLRDPSSGRLMRANGGA